MTTPKATTPEPTFDHFVMTDQFDRELLFTSDGTNYTRRWLNPPTSTPAVLVIKTISKMAYGINWLTVCERRAAGDMHPRTWSSPEEYNPAQQVLDDFFGPNPRVLPVTP